MSIPSPYYLSVKNLSFFDIDNCLLGQKVTKPRLWMPVIVQLGLDYLAFLYAI